jgi:hypothetical protein
VAAGNHFKSAERGADVRQPDPDDHPVERPLHASPVLMGKHPPVDLLAGQMAAVEGQNRSRVDGRKLEAEFGEDGGDARIGGEAMERDQVLGLLAVR